jgi:hypothetical protein
LFASLQTYIFKTSQQSDMAKVEKLHNMFFRLMATKKLDGEPVDMDGALFVVPSLS